MFLLDAMFSTVCVHCRLNTDSPSVDNQTYGQHETDKSTTDNVELMFSDEIQQYVFVTIKDM